MRQTSLQPEIPVDAEGRCDWAVVTPQVRSLIGTDFISRISDAAINPERQLFHVKAHSSYCCSGSDSVYILLKKIFFLNVYLILK